MDLQYPGNEDEFVQPPSSDIYQTSSPPPPLNAFSQAESDILSANNWGPDLELDGDTEPIRADLDPSGGDLGDEQSVPADSTEFHPLINGMSRYINYNILQLLTHE